MIQIGLHSGGRMVVRDDDTLDVSQVTPGDLAFGLSHVTRFGGMAGSYSVCEHSVRMYKWAAHDGQDKAVRRAILLHDAPECLGEGDHQRFVKRRFFGSGPAVYSHLVCSALWSRFPPLDRSVSWWTWDTVYRTLKDYDEWIGSLEARAFGFPHDPIPDHVDPQFAPRPGCFMTAVECLESFLWCWENSE